MCRVGTERCIGCSKICVFVCLWVNVYVCNEANLTRTLNNSSSSSSYSNTKLNWEVYEDETQERHAGGRWFHTCTFSAACSLLSSCLSYQWMDEEEGKS